MKKKLLEIKYEYNFVHCGDPWTEFHTLIIYEDGSVFYEDFMDDRIPYTIKKRIKNDCSDYLIKELNEITEKYKSYLTELQGKQIENYGKGFSCNGYVEFSGYKKIQLKVHNIFKILDGEDEGISNDAILKGILEEISELVKRYCLESLPITVQLGYSFNCKLNEMQFV